ncbi:Uncharacterized protein SCF082_LOCUS49493 [Durusdinium trenchii]|uniref:Reverse transcriptase domain-containing protein n=1 Tax=Durusdinium trenchii TaxID=1381693 RepID=A0ABP0S1L4_9DINO
MRNPHLAIPRIPGLIVPGSRVRAILEEAQLAQPELTAIGRDILTGREAIPFPAEVIAHLRARVVQALGGAQKQRDRTARATTPIEANVIEAWGNATGDPDSATLCEWLDHGAPLGYHQSIPTNGIFPTVPSETKGPEGQQDLYRSLEGWQNYKSAQEEADDLDALISDYVGRGFCHLSGSMEEATAELGRPPVLNKLGVVVKYNAHGTKKSRIIWDLRESRANQLCNQGERILLPRLLDVAQQAIRVYRSGSTPWLAAVDIRDAFMNIPSGQDKRYTVAARPKPGHEDQMELIIFDTLVFGAGSSPTLWGRYAAWLGRSCASIMPRASTQIYVDDPTFVLAGTLETASEDLTTLLLWINVVGFPVKLAKAEGGKTISWVGAKLDLNDKDQTVRVTIPQDKVAKIQETTQLFLKRPVVGQKQLRSYAGMLSFVAGLIPHLRPFLASLWAVLGKDTSANDGAGKVSHSGKLVHTRRIKPALSLGHGAAVRAKSDNLGVLCMLAKGGAKSPQLNSLAREFALDQALKAYRLHWLEHIPGVTNLEADALSRQTAPNPVAFPEHLKQATRSDVSVGPDFWKGFALPVRSTVQFEGRDRPGPTRPRPNDPPDREVGTGEPKPYGRGSAEAALCAAQDPHHCRLVLARDASAASTKGPTASRQKLWENLARTAGWTDPFRLDPTMIYTVMGALKVGGYRSAQLYLDAAKQCHISLGLAWDSQLQQAYRAAVRSCQRGIGHAKQASGLPLDKVADLPRWEQLVPGGPSQPVTATLLTSWWLLREIEASRARRKHISLNEDEQKVTWRLPSSKTDQAALDQWVFPTASNAAASKRGWADTFEVLAARLGLPTQHGSWPPTI